MAELNRETQTQVPALAKPSDNLDKFPPKKLPSFTAKDAPAKRQPQAAPSKLVLKRKSPVSQKRTRSKQRPSSKAVKKAAPRKASPSAVTEKKRRSAGATAAKRVKQIALPKTSDAAEATAATARPKPIESLPAETTGIQAKNAIPPAKLKQYHDLFERARKEMRKSVVGQDQIIDSLFLGLICNGNVLMEGVPGVAKTLIIRTLATVTGCDFKRIQFTADLLPSDIVGIMAYQKEKGFYIVKGPIFANFVLADEVNRAPPKTQSAMLEAMQERQVSISNTTYPLDPPFFVMATQNPLESLGTYPLPDAQMDRFLFKLKIEYPSKEEEEDILNKNISTRTFGQITMESVLDKKSIIEMQETVKKVYSSNEIMRYIVTLVSATRFPKKYNITLGKYIQYGGSPRASISLYIASKARALLSQRSYVIPSDVKEVAHAVLRHRVSLNYEGQAENVTSDDVIDEILKKVPIP